VTQWKPGYRMMPARWLYARRPAGASGLARAFFRDAAQFCHAALARIAARGAQRPGAWPETNNFPSITTR
jgi:hypothetical protein